MAYRPRKVRGVRPDWYVVIFRANPRRWFEASVALFGSEEACRKFAAHHAGDDRYVLGVGPCGTAERGLSDYLNVMDALPSFARF